MDPDAVREFLLGDVVEVFGATPYVGRVIHCSGDTMLLRAPDGTEHLYDIDALRTWAKYRNYGTMPDYVLANLSRAAQRTPITWRPVPLVQEHKERERVIQLG